MVLIHLVYDLVELYQILDWTYPPFFTFLKNWGGTAFLLISGVCAALGKRNLSRGITVLGCGMIVTAVTHLTGSAIRFGVLHCLGLCMILWCLFRRWRVLALCIAAAALVALGLWFSQVTVNVPYLFWLGLTEENFISPDYFPLLPCLGFFLLGAATGRTLYKSGQSLLPDWNNRSPVIRFLCLCGRHSLPIYLLHQPVLIGLLELICAIPHHIHI